MLVPDRDKTLVPIEKHWIFELKLLSLSLKIAEPDGCGFVVTLVKS